MCALSGVKTMTAPGPLLRVFDEAALYGIEVHVIYLFVFLANGPHVEVIETRLPEAAFTRPVRFGPEAHLRTRCFLAPTVPECPWDALFEHLQDGAGCASRGLCDEQVNVFGHDDKAPKKKIVAVSNIGENFEEYVARGRGPEKRFPAVTTAGDEMEMIEAVPSLKAVLHLDTFRRRIV
jgi:hypothetical protein